MFMDDEEDNARQLSHKERQRVPYVLLVNDSRTRAAVYNAQHRLMAAEATPQLLAWALAHATQVSPWDSKLDHRPRERPAWIPAGPLPGWQLMWLRDGDTTDEHIRATPRG